MNKLLPINNEADEKFKRKLNQVLGIDEVEKFINFYNLGLLSTNNKAIKGLAEDVQDSYRNIEINRKYISVLSEQETAVTAIEQLMHEWRFVTALKSLANQMLNEGYSPEDRIIFTKKNKAIPNVLDPENTDKLIKHWSNRSLADNYDDIKNNMFVEGIKENYDEEGNTVAYKIASIIQIDDSFVLDLEQFIVDAARQSAV